MKTKNIKKDNREIEVRFLEINKDQLIKRLNELGAEDIGEDFLKEIIFYNNDLRWQKVEKKIVRLRQTKSAILLTYKHNQENTATGTEEIEIEVSHLETTKNLLERIGLVAFREQEKKRHTFKLGEVIIDIDTWPSIPTYVELEGPSEESLKKAAKLLELDWEKVVFESPRFVIEKYYNIPVSELKYFTFSKIG